MALFRWWNGYPLFKVSVSSLLIIVILLHKLSLIIATDFVGKIINTFRVSITAPTLMMIVVTHCAEHCVI